MSNRLGGCGLVIIVLVGLVGLCVLCGGLSPRFNSESEAQETSGFFLPEGYRRIYLPNTSPLIRPIVKNELDFWDGLANMAFLAASTVIVFFVGIVGGPVIFLWGIVTNDWGTILAGILTFITAFIGPFGIWFQLISVKGTAAYYTVMAPGVLTVGGLQIFQIFGVVRAPDLIIRIWFD